MTTPFSDAERESLLADTELARNIFSAGETPPTMGADGRAARHVLVAAVARDSS